jgi:uncharacterized protein
MKTHLPRAYDDLHPLMQDGRVLVLYGPRRVGKTTLVHRYLQDQKYRTLEAVGDDIAVRNLLAGQDRAAILAWVSGYDALFLDEAQRIPNVGWALKLLIDARPDLKIIATGSASFDLASKVGEPLTGRQVPLRLYPLSILELQKLPLNEHEIKQNLPEYLVYGMYPEVLTSDTAQQKQFVLQELVSSYLYKDILEIERVKSAKILSDLLVLLAFQIGNEVSLNELAGQLGIDVKTVARYIDLFEKSFVLYNLRGFSRNLRNEVTSKSKYYFYDTGVRNAVIGNLNPLALRNDVGALWENFMVIERLKTRSYTSVLARDYFWRTWEQKEIDLIEDRGGRLHTYEFKWSPKKFSVMPPIFSKTYPGSEFTVVHQDNFMSIL